MYFIPIIPMILINGADGIGTGFSTFIPKYNIKDIITNIKRILTNEKPYKLTPWYNKFEGTIEKNGDNFVAKGKYIRIDDTKIKIIVLPIGTYFDNYKEYLEKISEHNKENKVSIIKTYTELVVGDDIHFTVEFFSKQELDKLIQNNLLQKKLKLTKNINITNMHLFNKDLILTKYTNPNQILLEFYNFRLPYYSKKRQYKINELKSKSEVLLAKTRFIREYTDDVLDINKKPKDYVISLLKKTGYPTFEPKLNYDYLITMPISSITLEKIRELEAQRDSVLQELEYYQSSTDKSLWLEDLELLDQRITN
jgi:DNA topoisomerase-2